jgi:hypothetical protein
LFTGNRTNLYVSVDSLLPPDEDDWGALDADEFLQVVDDVTT